MAPSLKPPPLSLGIRVLVDAREKLHIPWGDPDNKEHGDIMMAFDTRSDMIVNGQMERTVFMKYLPSIAALWTDSGIQNAYDRRREFQLVSGLSYTYSHCITSPQHTRTHTHTRKHTLTQCRPLELSTLID